MKTIKSKSIYVICLYLLTVLLEAKSCGKIENNFDNANSNPVETGYIPILGLTKDLCDRHFDNQNSILINITIMVKDKKTNSFVVWSEPGVINPAKYLSKDLKRAGQFGLTPNCLFSKLPGNNVEFIIKGQVIGDCCNNCPVCSTNGIEYYGKSIFEGTSASNIYIKNKNGGDYLTFDVSLIAQPNCLYQNDQCLK